MQNQNNQAAKEQTNLNQQDDLKIENFPIHTMKKDIEEIDNPEAKLAMEESPSSKMQPQAIQEKLTENQKSSPFLNLQAEKKPVVTPSAPQQPAQEIRDSRINIKQEETKTPNGEEPKTSVNLGRVIITATIIIIVLAAAGGAYYFWATRQKSVETSEIPTVPESTDLQPEKPEPVAAQPFLTDKPNYLSTDFTNLDGPKLKETIQEYAKQVSAFGVLTPVEFIFTDAKNNPVVFSDFADKLGMTFSKPLMANLSDNFSLYIYNDKAVTRLGISIESKDPAKLKGLMSLEEKNLQKEIAPIFLAQNFTLQTKKFSSSSYNSTAIRYTNITSPEDLSIDYAIQGKELLIGTTKMTLRSILDMATISASPVSSAPAVGPTGLAEQSAPIQDTSASNDSSIVIQTSTGSIAPKSQE